MSVVHCTVALHPDNLDHENALPIHGRGQRLRPGALHRRRALAKWRRSLRIAELDAASFTSVRSDQLSAFSRHRRSQG